MRCMEHLIPTLLGIAGALAPVALEYWRLERRSSDGGRRYSLRSRPAPEFWGGEAMVRGGRVFLYR